SFAPHAGDWKLIGGSAFAISLVYVMYAYSGWNASTYIVNEIRDPGRNVPRSVMLGTLLVLILYVALNAVFLFSTPMPEMAAAALSDLGLSDHATHLSRGERVDDVLHRLVRAGEIIRGAGDDGGGIDFLRAHAEARSATGSLRKCGGLALVKKIVDEKLCAFF